MWDVQTGVKPIETCFNIQYEKMYSSEKINVRILHSHWYNFGPITRPRKITCHINYLVLQ